MASGKLLKRTLSDMWYAGGGYGEIREKDIYNNGAP